MFIFIVELWVMFRQVGLKFVAFMTLLIFLFIITFFLVTFAVRIMIFFNKLIFVLIYDDKVQINVVMIKIDVSEFILQIFVVKLIDVNC